MRACLLLAAMTSRSAARNPRAGHLQRTAFPPPIPVRMPAPAGGAAAAGGGR
jgi:hypothetical protein